MNKINEERERLSFSLLFELIINKGLVLVSHVVLSLNREREKEKNTFWEKNRKELSTFVCSRRIFPDVLDR
jgi:hypothetical protein